MDGQGPRFSQGGSPARSRMRVGSNRAVDDPGRVDRGQEGESGSASTSDDDSSDSDSDWDEEEGDAAEVHKDCGDHRLLSGVTELQTGKAAGDALRQYAAANAFKIVSSKTATGGSSKKYTCASAPACGVFFSTRKLSSGKWHVSKSHTEHTNCTSFAVPSASAIAKLKVFNSLVKGNRGASAKELGAVVQVRLKPQCCFFLLFSFVFWLEVQPMHSLVTPFRLGSYQSFHSPRLCSASSLVQGEMGTLPSKSKLYRARNIVLEELDGDYAEKYQLVGPILDKFAELNPGSVARMECDSDGRFSRYILMEGDAVVQVGSMYPTERDCTFITTLLLTFFLGEMALHSESRCHWHALKIVSRRLRRRRTS